MSKLIKAVFDTYGNDIPRERHLFSAKEESPVSVLEINKEFGSYKRFMQAYHAYCANKRKMETKIVTKELKPHELKKEL